MRQLTIRGLDGELERRIRAVARREGISLNKAVVRLLRRSAGLEEGLAPADAGMAVGDALDAFFGTWSSEEAIAFEKATADLERIDPEIWR